MTTHQTAAESATVMAAKLSPPAAATMVHLMGVSVPDLVLYATLIYTVLMIAHKLYQWVKEIHSDLQ